MHHAAIISEHISDINELRKTIAYCEGRILRKQIAIEEARLGHEVADPGPTRIVEGMNGGPSWVARDENQPMQSGTCLVTAKEFCGAMGLPMPHQSSVGDLVRDALPEFAGKTFWFSDIKKRLLEKHPADETRIRRGVHSAVTYLIATKKIVRTVGGLQLP
jgi:hypothetical protein